MKRTMIIKDRKIGEGFPCFIIAEAGVNHNGSLELAKKLIDVAAEAGVDAVKFQTYVTDDLILNNIQKPLYQKRTTAETESQTDMLKRLEIDRSFHESLILYCQAKGILFLSTCYEMKSLELLMDLGLPAIKIASTDTTNLMFLEDVARQGKPVILSTGMSSEREIQDACRCLRNNGCKDLVLLKCTSNYPTELKEVNLAAMQTLKEKFDCIIGFSDHTAGVGASPYAVALGAKIVEKHFTLDKTMDGPDHLASLSPQELKEWVERIRLVEMMLGSHELKPTDSEKETKYSLQKYFVSTRKIEKGEALTREKIVAKRTDGKGISASKYYEILGKKVLRDFGENQIIEWCDLADV